MATSVVEHYGRNSAIVDGFVSALAAVGVPRSEIQPSHLAGGDEFHLGGAVLSDLIVDGIDLGSGDQVIDLGCGVGGLARRLADRTAAEVTGIDLTPEFVGAARELTELVGLSDRISFETGSVLEQPFGDDSFDVATMFHVGMNIEAKNALMAEVARIVRPGGQFIIYDIMRVGPGDVSYPVPWASDQSFSFLARDADYLGALKSAGFDPGEPLSHLAKVADVLAAGAANPPLVNLGHLMGAEFPSMIGNLGAALNAGIVAPVQITATLRTVAADIVPVRV